VAWDEIRDPTILDQRLSLLVTYSETPAVDTLDLDLRRWIERLKGEDESDAAFIVRRFARLPMDSATRDALYEEMQLLLKLAWGRGGPSRTRHKLEGWGTHFHTRPLRRERPDLWRVAAPRAVRSVSVERGERMIAAAREAMVVRGRDLDVFAYGDPRDVRLVHFDEGLSFAAIGFKPERRLLFEAVYGFLTLKNGVPVGYVLAGALQRSAEVAYNVFDTWRGYEAAHVYGCVLAMLRCLFGAEAFMVPPYQLGHDNDEGLKSGAWWFYQKLGFRPREREALRLMRRELARVRRSPGYRSSLETLQALSASNMYLERGPRRKIMGVFPLESLGLAVTDYLASHFGSDRERGLAHSVAEARRRLGLRELAGWRLPERAAFERWSPLLCLLPGIEGWPAADRRALVQVVRAKGGRRESDFVLAFDRHARLIRGLLGIASRVRV
jgi:hypothetical protein